MSMREASSMNSSNRLAAVAADEKTSEVATTQKPNMLNNFSVERILSETQPANHIQNNVAKSFSNRYMDRKRRLLMDENVVNNFSFKSNESMEGVKHPRLIPTVDSSVDRKSYLPGN